MRIHENDMPVLMAFLESEARDFSKHKGKESAFADFRIKKILEATDGKKIWNLKIVRLGNTGCETGSLNLDTAELGGDHRVKAEVFLCNCGQDACWGNVNIEEPT